MSRRLGFGANNTMTAMEAISAAKGMMDRKVSMGLGCGLDYALERPCVQLVYGYRYNDEVCHWENAGKNGAYPLEIRSDDDLAAGFSHVVRAE